MSHAQWKTYNLLASSRSHNRQIKMKGQLLSRFMIIHFLNLQTIIFILHSKVYLQHHIFNGKHEFAYGLILDSPQEYLIRKILSFFSSGFMQNE